MTKKHLQALLAGRIATTKPTPGNDPFIVWLRVVTAIAGVCAQANPNFDYARFFTACGMETK